MDELEEIKQSIQTMKETLIFLVEQEKVRGEEVSALNERIEAVNDTLVNRVIMPTLEAYEEEKFNEFDSKYKDKFSAFDDVIRIAQNNPEYSSTREAWDRLQAMPEEERNQVDVDGYMDASAEGVAAVVAKIKETLGLPEDTKIAITQDEDGNTEVKADLNGDGEAEETVAEEKTETAEEPAPEDASSEEDEDTLEIDPELQKELDDYLK